MTGFFQGYDNTDDDVRLVRPGEERFVAPPPSRSNAQQIRDDILEQAETKLRQARDLADEAIELFSLLAPPQHKNLSNLIGQQIEQVIEHRRAKQ